MNPSSQQPIQQEQIFISNSNGTSQDLYFDSIVEALQDAVLQLDFIDLQESFMKNKCLVFEDKEENKIQYMPIFQQYQKLIEKNIMEYLSHRIPDFNMKKFSHLLESRVHQIDEELLEMLNSFTDFQAFKQLMLEHKKYYDHEDSLKGLTIKGAVCRLP